VHGIDQVFTKAIDSPDAAQLTHSTANCRGPFWSRDGASVYYFARNAMWAVPAWGGLAEIALDNTPGATIHPDGQTVVFVRDGKLWVASLMGGQPRQFGEARFAAAAIPFGFPKFSPNGSKLITSIGNDP
jgi:Tol biopolymer transport system component